MNETASLRPLIDDPRVRDNDTLLRVVSPAFFADREVQSRAFQDQTEEAAARWGLAGPCASVCVRSIWEAKSGRIADLLRDFDEGAGVLEVAVAAARSLKGLGPNPLDVAQGLMLDPRERRPWHAVMFTRGGGKRTRGAMTALKHHASWFWHPEDA